MRSTPTSSHRVFAALVALALVLAACAGAAGPQFNSSGDDVDNGAPQKPGGASGYEEPDGGGQRSVVYDAARPDILVIKTGTMALQVESVASAVEAATAAITKLDGYVSGSEQNGDGDELVATLRFRIPAAAWEDALTALRALAIKVVAERTETEDVTGQVVDLRARIANLQATERALQSIMTQATEIKDVLAVQSELTKVRADIESLTAQRAQLEEQAAFSTLAVSFSREPEAAVVTSSKKFDPKSEIDRATASLVEVLQSAAAAGIWFGIVWLPILLVLGVVAIIVMAILRRRMPRRGWAGQALDAGTPPPPADPPA